MKEEKKTREPFPAVKKGVKHGIDPRYIPQKITGTVPEGKNIQYPDYSKSEHEIWKLLYLRQMKFFPGKVCDEYLHGLKMLKISSTKIPALRELSEILKRTTNWTITRVPGRIYADDFYSFLKRRTLPSTDYIRTSDDLDSSMVPDLFHDVFGHMPLMTDPNFASFYQKFGEAALNATGKDRKQLETFHWFTVEKGLIKKRDGARIFGAGIVSSKAEFDNIISEDITIKVFEPEKIVKQEYKRDTLQSVFFAVDSFEQLEKGFLSWAKKRKLI